MSHIDPEILAIEALEGPVLNGQDAAHLTECGQCQDELLAMSRTVRAGRSGAPDGLMTPGPHVWEAIAAEVAGDVAVADAGSSAASPEQETSAPPASPRHLAPRRRRWPRVAVVASALTAGAAAVAITVALLIPRPVGIATARLDAFPAHPGAHGTAELEREPDGSERVRVELDADLADDGFREVWLLTEDGSALVSLGVLDGRSGSFAVPADIDTGQFSVVDVSQEPTDGGAEHSGDSIVRGQLSRS